MENVVEAFDKLVRQRRSVRMFDTEHKMDKGVITRSLERAVLAPNSFNLQLWSFYHVTSPDKKEALVKACMSQRAAKTASELVVVVSRKDLWNQRRKYNTNHLVTRAEGRELTKPEEIMIGEFKGLMPWVYFNDPLGIIGMVKKGISAITGLFMAVPRMVGAGDISGDSMKNTAFAAQNFIMSVEAEGYASCAMNGFDGPKVKKIIDLPFGAEISMVIAVGKRTEEGVYGEQYRVPNTEAIYEI